VAGLSVRFAVAGLGEGHRIRGSRLGRAALAVAISALVAVSPLGLIGSAAARTPLMQPSIEASFSPSTIQLGSTTTMKFRIQNQDAAAITGVNFTDNLPSGLRVMNDTRSVCGDGTLTVIKASNYIALSGLTIAGSSACTFSVEVTSFGAGVLSTTTSAVTSPDTYDGNKATASVTVYSPPTIEAAFTPSTVAFGGTTQLIVTLRNPNASVYFSGRIGITGTVPAGLTIYGSSGVSICGGTYTIDFGTGRSFTVTGAGLPTNSSCSFPVEVQGEVAGNSTATVTATLDGAGYAGNTASAVLHVNPRPATPGPTAPPAAATPTTVPGTTAEPGATVGSTGEAPATGSSSTDAAATPKTPEETAAFPTSVPEDSPGVATTVGGWPVGVVIGLGVGLLALVVLVAYLVTKRRNAR
jgi:uncharacterized repeat protein (TIGR01451 family)